MTEIKIESDPSDHPLSIKEDPEEYNSSSKDHNHSRDCDHAKVNVHEDHAHSDFGEPTNKKHLPPIKSVS